MQRWEREQGLPVHRLGHNRAASVYALPPELDAWWEKRRFVLAEPAPAAPAQEAGPLLDTGQPSPATMPDGTSNASPRPALAARGPVRAGALAAAALVVLGALLGWAFRARTPEIASIAVVPFGFSGTGDAPIVAAGVSEEIVRYLARIRSVRVLGGSSNARAAGEGSSMAAVARALGADAVLTGRLHARANEVEVEVRLTLAGSGEELWNGRYRGPVEATDRSRGAALSLVAQLSERLWPSEKVPDAQVRVQEAYLAYMRGRYLLAKRERSALVTAEKEFRLALRSDPMFTDAAAGLADTLILLGVFGAQDQARAYPAAKAAAREALEHDPDNAEAYKALAFATEMFDHDWSLAEAHFHRAIALDPSSSAAHHWYALLLDSSLRGEEAIREIETARALEPMSASINSDLGMILAHQGHVQEAIAQFTRTLAIDPTYVDAYAELGYAYREAGDVDKAVQSFQHALELGADPVEVHFNLVICEARRGRLAVARQMVAELRRPGRFPIAVTDIHEARELIAIGEYDRGLGILLAHPEYGDVNWLVGSIYRPLWRDARFHELLRRVGLLDTLRARLDRADA